MLSVDEAKVHSHVCSSHPRAEQAARERAARTQRIQRVLKAQQNEDPCLAIANTQRRGPITMALLWITMVTSFPTFLIGLEWHRQGFTLFQVVSGTAIASLLLLAYYVPSAQLGARTGLSYGALAKRVFGRFGWKVVNFNLIWLYLAWYGLCALFLADGIRGLFMPSLPMWGLAAGFAVLMTLNNFLGFKGVANFARYIAGPVLIAWVCFTFCKTVIHGTLPVVPNTAAHPSFAASLCAITSFIIGFAIWGNECDYWRFGRAKTSDATFGLGVALLIGEIVFPVTGWLVAQQTGITDPAVATKFMNEYSFGGLSVVAALVLGASYFAANDANLFAMIQACQTFKRWSHKNWVALVAVITATVAALLSASGSAKSLEAIASLNCIVLPTATVIMMAEWAVCRFLLNERSGIEAPQETMFADSPRVAANVALVCGWMVGIGTAGLLPGTEALKVGIPALQAWFIAVAVFVPLRLMESKQNLRRRSHVRAQNCAPFVHGRSTALCACTTPIQPAKVTTNR